MDTIDNKETCGCDHHGWKRKKTGGASGAVYGLGFVGAVVYYLQHAPTFWMGVVGIFKAMVWPAFLIYEALKALSM